MKANPYPLQTILGEKQQWVVPVYQRHYEWETGEDKQIHHLWEDLEDKANEYLDDSRTLYPHYFGAIICSEQKVPQFGATPQRFLIDGQQRITTFNILLAALKEYARANEYTGIETALKSYLLNEKSESMTDPEREKFKLWPSSYDRNLFKLIVSSSLEKVKEQRKSNFYKNGHLKKSKAPKMLVAYLDLLGRIEGFVKAQSDVEIAASNALSALIGGFLQGFQLVLIELDEQDDAQEIFASLNGLAKPLSPFDLIRNDVFLRSKKLNEDPEELFEGRWKTFEEPFWSTMIRQGRSKRARTDHLIAHSVVAETGREISVTKIASEYQRFARDAKFESVAAELDHLIAHAQTYRQLEELSDEHCTTPLGTFLRIWDTFVFHPLILTINSLVEDETQKVIMFKMLESYIIRRDICNLTQKSYNRLVPTLIRQLRSADDPFSHFPIMLKHGTSDISRYPEDQEMVAACLTLPIYYNIPSRRLRYIFSNVENALRTRFDEVKVAPENVTIEHILPQKWADYWTLPNGEKVNTESDWIFDDHNLSAETKKLIETRNTLLHTLGNLTLLTPSGNPSVGNKGWAEKKEFFSGSLLALNRNVGQSHNWNELEIKSRGKILATEISKIWSIS